MCCGACRFPALPQLRASLPPARRCSKGDLSGRASRRSAIVRRCATCGPGHLVRPARQGARRRASTDRRPRVAERLAHPTGRRPRLFVKIVVVGAGGVGAAAPPSRSGATSSTGSSSPTSTSTARTPLSQPLGDGPVRAARIDASDVAALVALIARRGADAVLNAVDPRFNPPIFVAAFEARCTYLDMATTLSEPHPGRPYERAGREARRPPVRRARGVAAGRPARARRDRRRAGALRRLRALRGR